MGILRAVFISADLSFVVGVGESRNARSGSSSLMASLILRMVPWPIVEKGGNDMNCLDAPIDVRTIDAPKMEGFLNLFVRLFLEVGKPPVHYFRNHTAYIVELPSFWVPEIFSILGTWPPICWAP